MKRLGYLSLITLVITAIWLVLFIAGLAGALLALNGVACILGIVGFLARNAPLSLGTLAGGVLFLLALVPMSLTVFKEVV